jgi:hypothetical protein
MPEEDDQLRKLVAVHGEDWSTISVHMPERTGRQCHERWLHYLSPGIIDAPWTHEEEAIIEAKVKEYGQQWKFIERYLPGRRDSHIKNHYKVLLRRRAKEEKKALGLPLKTRRPHADPPSAEPGWETEFDLFPLEHRPWEAFEPSPGAFSKGADAQRTN